MFLIMKPDYQPAIKGLLEEIARIDATARPLKMSVNTLHRLMGEPEPFDLDNVENNHATAARPPTWRVDQFTGRVLSTCVVEILETNREHGLDGPATVDELFAALTAGGFRFQGTSGNEENTKRAIKIALTKNTTQFTKIKDDLYGLKKWYPSRGQKRSPAAKGSVEQAEVGTDGGAEDEGQSPFLLQQGSDAAELEPGGSHHHPNLH
jgi:hypothetical protein